MAFRIMRAKWALVERRELSASGYEEIVAMFTLKREAEEWMRLKRLDRKTYRIVKVND